MDRTKEPGALGEPLYMDVVHALCAEAGRGDITVVGGRYGLGSKDTPPSSRVRRVRRAGEGRARSASFTVGIVDDVTNLSLPEDRRRPNTAAAGTIECKFWGLGGDGTVGANKNSIKIIGDHTDMYVPGLLPVRLQEDRRRDHQPPALRRHAHPQSTYYVNKADFVACHNPSYVDQVRHMVHDVKPGGTFLLNCQWTRGRAGAAPARRGQALYRQERHQALHHRRHRPGPRDRHGQAHQHHPAVRVLHAGQRHPHGRGHRST